MVHKFRINFRIHYLTLYELYAKKIMFGILEHVLVSVSVIKIVRLKIFFLKKYTCVKIPIGDSVITCDQVMDTPS